MFEEELLRQSQQIRGAAWNKMQFLPWPWSPTLFDSCFPLTSSPPTVHATYFLSLLCAGLIPTSGPLLLLFPLSGRLYPISSHDSWTLWFALFPSLNTIKRYFADSFLLLIVFSSQLECKSHEFIFYCKKPRA